MRKTVVINVVGLTPSLIGASTPALAEFQRRGRMAAIEPVIPAVTCSAQATYFTGVYPDRHGIVANGWYFRDECEVRFWRQSNKLVEAPKVWDMARARDSKFTCANLFGWYNMYSTADYSVTPRPMYPADGRKIPDVYSEPGGLRGELQARFGQFPLFHFWGPAASIESSQWIANAALYVDEKHDPTLTLIYLPHLDYNLQRLGPGDPRLARDLGEIDSQFEKLRGHYEARGARVLLISEYGIEPVSLPIHINRLLREKGLLRVREELGRELLDAGASAAFAVADHQIAHIYLNDPAQAGRVRSLVESLPGVDAVLDEAGKKEQRLGHPRSGELIAIAARGAWFTYYYWLDDRRAPDFARTVDIHRKPGYDPVELFLDPRLPAPKVTVGLKLAKKLLGFRYLMDVIPLDASLVKGSHGRPPASRAEGPLCVTSEIGLLDADSLPAGAICNLILNHLTKEI
ncbi:MAG TPA: alkaline phosphatase family protein [Bryobacteraceae bacterium]|nr:alkaline phosphatase family protein [Bryobacteraceae bacterium]